MSDLMTSADYKDEWTRVIDDAVRRLSNEMDRIAAAQECQHVWTEVGRCCTTTHDYGMGSRDKDETTIELRCVRCGDITARTIPGHHKGGEA